MQISLAAGKSIEPFWELYSQHKKQEVYKMLENLRIGNLRDEDVKRATGGSSKGEGPYANEPARNPVLIKNSETPCNAEPPLNILIDNFLTPNDIFFVRNHLPVPQVDKKSYRLTVEVPGRKEPLVLTLDDLKTKFKPTKVVATIQCAGNRRDELNSVEKVKGLTWGCAAISTAEWKGVRLRDVLTYAGLPESSFLNFDDPYATQHKEDNKTVRHVSFEGLDKDPEGTGYSASIPVTKAMNPYGDVILAYEMNGEELPRDHGFPVRLVVPGKLIFCHEISFHLNPVHNGPNDSLLFLSVFILLLTGHVGARNVKWLSRITASSKECEGHWQQHDYKGMSFT